jgi:hypothetical protein
MTCVASSGRSGMTRASLWDIEAILAGSALMINKNHAIRPCSTGQ